MRLALYQPDIAGNVGTILRTAACLGIGVDLIEPMGFPWSDRALARAGMDYASRADIVRHADWNAFATAVAGRIGGSRCASTPTAAQRAGSQAVASSEAIRYAEAPDGSVTAEPVSHMTTAAAAARKDER